MVKFKQKDFIAPVIPMLASLGVEGAIGVAGNSAQKKANEEQTAIMEQQAEQQAEANRAMQKTLDKIAENASKNPMGAAQAAVQTMQQKQYANVGSSILSFARNAKGFAKDLGPVIWKRKNDIIGGVLGGSALAGGAYLADKYVQHDMKKSGIKIPEKSDAPVQKSYATIGGVLKGTGKVLKDAVKENKGMIATLSVMGAAPVLAGYASNKAQMKDQIKATSGNANKNSNPQINKNKLNQKTYSIGSFIKSGWNSLKKSNFGQTVKKNYNTFNAHRGQSILGFISNNIAMGGGRKGVERFGDDLIKQGAKSGNKWTQKAGNFVKNYPKTAIAASIPIGLGVTAATWDQGEKLTKKALKKIDKNAFAYQESQNEEVQ